MLERLERRLGRFAIPNLTVYLVAGQAFFALVLAARPELLEAMLLIPQRVLAGEPWRLVSFLLVPPTRSLIFLVIALYLFWMMGGALERAWGSFRYNVYLLVGTLATVAAAFVTPEAPATNAYLGASVFLAFAALYPEFEFLLMFVLPVKVKWLALVTWILYGHQFLQGGLGIRLAIVASVSNFLLFFAPALVRRLRARVRRRAFEAKAAVEPGQAFHRCAKCGVTDVSHPQMEFRYCPHCAGSPGYCAEHIDDHDHVA